MGHMNLLSIVVNLLGGNPDTVDPTLSIGALSTNRLLYSTELRWQVHHRLYVVFTSGFSYVSECFSRVFNCFSRA